MGVWAPRTISPTLILGRAVPSENWPTLRIGRSGPRKISPTLRGKIWPTLRDAKWELADAKDWPHGAKENLAGAKDWEFADAGDGQDLVSVTFGGAAKRTLMGKSTTNEWSQCEKGGGTCQKDQGSTVNYVYSCSSEYYSQNGSPIRLRQYEPAGEFHSFFILARKLTSYYTYQAPID